MRALLAQDLNAGTPARYRLRSISGKQIACCTLFVGAAFAVPPFHRGQAHPQRMARPGQRHIEQAQVFAQTLLVGPGQLRAVIVQHQLARRAIFALHRQRQISGLAIQRPEAAAKRQADHRIFKALALVDGDDLDQIGIRLQPHDLGVPRRARGLDLRGQPADQRLLTLQLGAGTLQQLGQVQIVGQTPLATGFQQPARRQVEAIQGLAQHGQHAQAQPDAVQLLHLLAARIESLVIAGQPGQFVKRKVHHRRRQTCPHGQPIERRRHGTQPQQQVLRFAAGKHRVLVR